MIVSNIFLPSFFIKRRTEREREGGGGGGAQGRTFYIVSVLLYYTDRENGVNLKDTGDRVFDKLANYRPLPLHYIPPTLPLPIFLPFPKGRSEKEMKQSEDVLSNV